VEIGAVHRDIVTIEIISGLLNGTTTNDLE